MRRFMLVPAVLAALAVLFISIKIVGVHVSRILGRLSVANRSDETAIAHRLGLAPPPPGATPRFMPPTAHGGARPTGRRGRRLRAPTLLLVRGGVRRRPMPLSHSPRDHATSIGVATTPPPPLRSVAL